MSLAEDLGSRNSRRNENPWSRELPEDYASEAASRASEEDEFGHRWTIVGNIPAFRTSGVSIADEMGRPQTRGDEGVDQRDLKKGYNKLNRSFSGREDYYLLGIRKECLRTFTDAEAGDEIVAGAAYFDSFEPEPCLVCSYEEAFSRLDSDEFENTWRSFDDWKGHTDYEVLMDEVSQTMWGEGPSPAIAPFIAQEESGGLIISSERQLVLGSDGSSFAEGYDNSHLKPGEATG
ncbi:MAG: hypothetical protein ABEJ03_03645 [Candidatus Nanohaloarchaea archaeon]